MGEIADGINALISLGRGDVAGATLSAASMVPIVGDAIVGCIFLGVVLIFEGINYAQNQSLSSSLAKINSASASVVAGAPAPMPPDDPDSKGTRVSSKTLYNKKGIHIDVENPGHRPGQIHVQQGNSKYLYDVGKKAFVNKAGELAPKPYQKLLEDPKVIKAIAKGLEILGY